MASCIVLFLMVAKNSLDKRLRILFFFRALCLISTWQATEFENSQYIWFFRAKFLARPPGGRYCAIKLWKKNLGELWTPFATFGKTTISAHILGSAPYWQSIYQPEFKCLSRMTASTAQNPRACRLSKSGPAKPRCRLLWLSRAGLGSDEEALWAR